MKYFLYLLSIFFIAPYGSYSQGDIPLGTWRTHFPYNSAHTVVATQDRIYCATSAGLFFYDLNDNSITTLSTVDGLSETQVSELAYSSTYNILLIAYTSGNIDLLTEDNLIVNITSLLEAENIGEDRQINHIFLSDRLAYLSTNFGVVVIDLIRQEVSATYLNLGATGTRLPIHAATIYQNQLFLASQEGILFAPLTSNLQFFGNYTFFDETDGIPQQPTSAIAVTEDVLYAGVEEAGLYQLENNTWSLVPAISDTTFYQLQSIDDQLYVCVPGRVYRFDGSFQTLANLEEPRQIAIDNQGTSWIADQQQGLWRLVGNQLENIVPNGVFSEDTWEGIFFDETILMVSGGYDDTYQPLQRESGFYQFQQGLWTNYNSAGTSDAITTPAIRDLTSAAYDPLTGTTYLVSFGEGILLRDSEGAFSLINNTSMQTPFFGNITVALTDVVVDLAGNAWFTQYEPSSGGAPLHLFTAQGWQSFPSINSATNRPLELLIDLNAYKWIRLEPSFTAGGLWVIDETNTRNKYLNSTIGNLNNERVLSMVQDKEGTIWLGTEDGVMVVFDSFNVFNEGFQVTIPTFEGRPLLRNEAVKCIAVDGGNRKWMGTENGVFLFDEEATQLIAHFTTDNSPLLSNNLLDIVIQGGTGEVFFCTDQGIISYRADATEASDSFGDVRIFPNPVRPDFDGMVAIEGLAQNADIRITDISGKLIFRTTANGGTATWNIRDYNGNRAATGVYLVFATNQSGEEATVGKIAVVSNE